MEWLHSSLFDLGLCFGRMRKRPHSLERRLQGRKGGRRGSGGKGHNSYGGSRNWQAATDGRADGDASEGEGEGGIKVGESERKKGRVSEVSVATDRGASAHDIGQNNGTLSLLRPRWTSLPFRQASSLSIIFPFAKTSFRFV